MKMMMIGGLIEVKRVKVNVTKKDKYKGYISI